MGTTPRNPNAGPRLGDLVAGASGVLLLIFMFLPWFKAGLEDDKQQKQLEEVADRLDIDLNLNAWQSFQIWDILLALIAIAAVVYLILRLADQLPVLPIPASTAIAALGALAVIIILFKLLVTPNIEIEAQGDSSKVKDADGGEVNRGIGAFLGLLAAIGIAAGGFLSTQEETADARPGGAAFGAGGQPGGALGGGQAAAAPPAGGAQAAAPAGGQPTQADWYPDPQGQARLRYWDGTQWTEHTSD